MITNAHFKPEQPAVENIIYTNNRGFTKKDIMELTTPQWITNAHNLILTGKTGCGKSFVAQAIALQACRMGFPAQNFRYNILFEEINAARGTGLFLKFLNKIARIKVLIIDDFVMQDITTQDLAALLEIIEEKQQTGSIIITTQYPIPKWHQRFPDPTMADAICDRLVNKAYKFHLEGESRRKNDTKSHVNDRSS